MATAPPESDLEVAMERLEAGGLVAFPTETVWGLGALASVDEAVETLRAWKGRGPAHPVSVLVTGASAVDRLGYTLGPVGAALADALWPGPLTLVVRPGPRAQRFAPGIAREDGAVGFRCSSHPATAALARSAEERGLGPVTATSLNRSGQPPAGTRTLARRLCAGPDAPWLWPAAGVDAGAGQPSTVVDVTGPEPRILREGAVAPERIQNHVADAETAQSQEQSNP